MKEVDAFSERKEVFFPEALDHDLLIEGT